MGGAGAAAGEGPADEAGVGLLGLPVRCLLGAVVGAARGMQVAFIRWAAWVRIRK